ncbi:MAG: Gx transporter family protein [bacterium]
MRSQGRVAYLALLIAAAFVLSSLERLLPNPVPMIRLGLGNIMTLTAFAVLGIRDGAWVTFGRVALVSLVWGGVFSPTAVMSLTGGAASLAVMIPLALSGGKFSLYGISIGGAFAHITAQLAVASVFYVQSADLFRLLPYMGSIALVTGIINGWISTLLASRLMERRRV